jgi:hypothetical protein
MHLPIIVPREPDQPATVAPRPRQLKMRVGRPRLPFGYRNGQGGMPIIDPPAAQAVREAFQVYLSTRSLASTARHLERCGFLSPSGRPWTARAVGRLLWHRAYTGSTAGRFWVPPGTLPLCPPIVSVGDFQQAIAFRGQAARALAWYRGRRLRAIRCAWSSAMPAVTP